MRQFKRLVGACTLAALLSACAGGQSNNSVMPAQAPTTDQQTDTGQAPMSASPTEQSLGTDAVSTQQRGIEAVEGTIAALRTGGGLTLQTASHGYVPVTYSSTTALSTAAGSATIGHYAIAAGSGSFSGITARYVATFATRPGTVTVTGTLTALTPYGFEVKVPVHGIIPVLTGSATRTSGTIATGKTVTVSGTGSTAVALLASTVSTDGTAVASGGSAPAASPDALAPASGTTGMRHVMTVSYIGTPFGTTAVSPSRAAPYLSWAETGVNNTKSMTAAGIRTLVYVDVNRQELTDPFVSAGSAAFAHSCSGSRIHDIHDNVVQYLMNPASSALRTAYAEYVRRRTAGNPVTAMFQDDSVAPGTYPKGFFSPSLPCGYTLSGWQSAQRGLQASIDQKTILNGLGSSSTWPLLDNPSTIGGNYEGCFATTASVHEAVGSTWLNVERLQTYITGRSKYFECMALDRTSAISAIRSRLYNIASFLMTYNPSYSMLWESYGTPSRISVMPESQLVPTSPIESNNITYLHRSTGVYMRQYRACYYAGRSIGPCAMVVNSDTVAHARPAFSYSFHHTMALHGYGVLDGGTATFNGVAPGSLAGLSAYIAVP